jgi:hypothetical protein
VARAAIENTAQAAKPAHRRLIFSLVRRAAPAAAIDAGSGLGRP